MDLIPIRTSTLRPNVPLLFDVYVQWKGQYLKYRQSSQLMEADRLERFSIKKIKKMFIKIDEEPHYLNYLDQALESLTQSDTKIEARAEMAKDTMVMEAENAVKNMDTEEGYKRTETRVNKVIDFITQDASAIKNMLSSAGISVDNSAHSATVASLSIALAAQLNYTDKDELTSISIAALLHDVGLAELGFDTSAQFEEIDKNRRPEFRKHPQMAVDMLSGKQFITPRVLLLILDHEEIGEGYGYPAKKRLARLLMSSQIFNLANAFDHFCMWQKKTSVEAIEDFIEKKKEHFPADHLNALKAIIQ